LIGVILLLLEWIGLFEENPFKFVGVALWGTSLNRITIEGYP
jgi:hypothetical protein